MTSGSPVNDGPTWSEERPCNKTITFDVGLHDDVRPDDCGCGPAMGVEGEFEVLDRAPASVRAGLLGQRDETSEYEVDSGADR